MTPRRRRGGRRRAKPAQAKLRRRPHTRCCRPSYWAQHTRANGPVAVKRQSRSLLSSGVATPHSSWR